MRTWAYIGFGAALTLLGCAPGDASSFDESSDEADLAATSELSAKADGMTLWIDPVAYPTTRFDQPAFRLEARASKNLENVFSFSSDDEYGEALMTSARKFDIWLDAGQMEHLLAGYRLLVDVDASVGSIRQYYASIKLQPKVVRGHGSSKLTLHKTVTPFVFGDEFRFRNSVRVASGYALTSAATDDGVAALLLGSPDASVDVDWSGASLVSVGEDASNEIAFDATNGSKNVTRNAGVDIVVSSLLLTTDSQPLAHWPDPTCKPSTLSCLEALPSGQLDRSSCGAAPDVWSCVYLLPATEEVTESTFAADFSEHLVTWYADHGADVAASGGNHRRAAAALGLT